MLQPLTVCCACTQRRAAAAATNKSPGYMKPAANDSANGHIVQQVGDKTYFVRGINMPGTYIIIRGELNGTPSAQAGWFHSVLDTADLSRRSPLSFMAVWCNSVTAPTHIFRWQKSSSSVACSRYYLYMISSSRVIILLLLITMHASPRCWCSLYIFDGTIMRIILRSPIIPGISSR